MTVIVALSIGWPTSVSAELATESCETKELHARLTVDQGHPWRPPFGLERVGAPAVAHVEWLSQQEPTGIYVLVAYSEGRELERHKLSFTRNRSYYAGGNSAPTVVTPFFAHAPLRVIPMEIALVGPCAGNNVELARQAVNWPQIEVQAVAHPDRQINPVDLGTIMPPHNGLLLGPGQKAIVTVAALSHTQDFPSASVQVWFDEGLKFEQDLPLKRHKRVDRQVVVPFTGHGKSTTLHVRLNNGERELWRRAIRTMVVNQPPTWPSFGAVETLLRYDAPIAAVNPATGQHRPSIDYGDAWDRKFKDVVVSLPNGSRFVFWRGSNFIPFWAGRYNTGLSYQWAENCTPHSLVAHPDGSHDCPEPLFDSELRYGRVRILESSASRVHVRWDYRLTDVEYKVFGGTAAEDFYFYPDGFGTRVVTLPGQPGEIYQLSEFIVMTPQGAYPLEILPRRMIEAVQLDGGIQRAEFPIVPAPQANPKAPPQVVRPDAKPMFYRLYSHKDDSAAALYFHPTNNGVPNAFRPFYDRGEQVTPVYWGNHWPLNRGQWTGWGINDRFGMGPGHSSIAGWSAPRDPKTGDWLGKSWEADPLTISEIQLPNAQGQVAPMKLARFVWLIAYDDLPDDTLRDWGKSFSSPPALEVRGARLDLPSYSPERRALRLIAEQPVIEIKVTPQTRTINPVFEIDQAPKNLANVTLDAKVLPTNAYAWNGAILWIQATISEDGAVVGVRFR